MKKFFAPTKFKVITAIFIFVYYIACITISIIASVSGPYVPSPELINSSLSVPMQVLIFPAVVVSVPAFIAAMLFMSLRSVSFVVFIFVQIFILYTIACAIAAIKDRKMKTE